MTPADLRRLHKYMLEIEKVTDRDFDAVPSGTAVRMFEFRTTIAAAGDNSISGRASSDVAGPTSGMGLLVSASSTPIAARFDSNGSQHY
jgi:hypothetical protein